MEIDIEILISFSPAVLDQKELKRNENTMASLLETIMLICFGMSWPMNAYKAYKARTAASTSLTFILLILFGYFCGVGAKLISGTINYVLVMYFINICTVMLNLIMYFRNKAIDNRKAQ